MPPAVSVIVVTRNRVDEVLRCLASVAAIEVPATEILVADNGSDDGTVKRVRAAHPRVRILAAPGNRGTSEARNAAAKLSTGRFLWFLDDDAEVTDPEFASRLVRAFDEDPRLGGVGGEAVVDRQGRRVGTKYLRLLANGLTEGAVLDARAGAVVVQCLASCNLFVPRRVFEAAGGFDARLFFFFLEDLDLTWRIARGGMRLEVRGDTPVLHRFASRSRRPGRFVPRRNRIFFVVKNLPALRIAALPVLDAAYLTSPARLRRFLVRASVHGLGARSAVTVDPGGAAVTARGLAEACAQAAWLVASLPVSYALALPWLGRMLAARRQGGGTLHDTDLSAWRVLEPRYGSLPPCSTATGRSRDIEEGDERGGNDGPSARGRRDAPRDLSGRA